jgi:hypothetical protein
MSAHHDVLIQRQLHAQRRAGEVRESLADRGAQDGLDANGFSSSITRADGVHVRARAFRL